MNTLLVVMLMVLLLLLPTNGVKRKCPKTKYGKHPTTNSNHTNSFHHRKVCDDATNNTMSCHARILLTNESGTLQPFVTQQPSGFKPADLKSYYVIPMSKPKCNTVAIVDAYYNPNAQSDLNVYRSTFGLGPMTVQQFAGDGGNITEVTTNSGWASETILDLQMISAICPCCPIIYVGAFSNSYEDLLQAVITAASKASVVSMSWGGSEDSSIGDEFENYPGVAFTASSGDNGYGVIYPSSSAYVTAVGGTSVYPKTGGGRLEVAWDGSGSGCSSYISKPSWQKDQLCDNRMVADVAAVADPNTGVAVYDTFGNSGWSIYGGTSVAAPIIAALYGLYYTPSTQKWPPAQALYSCKRSLYDVVSGSNGECPGESYLCNAGLGYDGPTGNGAPLNTAQLPTLPRITTPPPPPPPPTPECSCPGFDNSQPPFPLSPICTQLTGVELNCFYPNIQGDCSEQYYCSYNVTSRELIEDKDIGECINKC